MSILQAENALFDRWRESVPSLVSDGVVDEQHFLESAPRLVFVLKEVNDTRDGGGWDLRAFLREHWRPQTWDPVSRWVYGIRHIGRDLAWPDVMALPEEQLRAALRSICAVNIKKSPGSHTAVGAEVDAAAKRDKELLLSQLSLYSPAIYIWCGVSPELLYGSTVQWQTTERGVRHAMLSDTGDRIIQFAHPSVRAPRHMVYYSLIDAVRAIASLHGRVTTLAADGGR